MKSCLLRALVRTLWEIWAPTTALPEARGVAKGLRNLSPLSQMPTPLEAPNEITLCTGVYGEPPFWVTVRPPPPPHCKPLILKTRVRPLPEVDWLLHCGVLAINTWATWFWAARACACYLQKEGKWHKEGQCIAIQVTKAVWKSPGKSQSISEPFILNSLVCPWEQHIYVIILQFWLKSLGITPVQ